jgi:hypothetical protein
MYRLPSFPDDRELRFLAGSEFTTIDAESDLATMSTEHTAGTADPHEWPAHC